MTIRVNVIEDSISENNTRIITVECRYPRMIHAELMTHRVFSRNASSSRAIPVKKIIQDILDDTAMPSKFGRNQPGMQAGEDWNAQVQAPWSEYSNRGIRNSPVLSLTKEEAWFRARDYAIEIAQAFDAAGYHKQVVNRLLEPFSHITVLITATQWSNFFALRCHPDADPTINALAKEIYSKIIASTPKKLLANEWHMPYIMDSDYDAAEKFLKDNTVEAFPYTTCPLVSLLLRVSVARSARTSYKTHDGKATEFVKDIELYSRLAGGIPLHASPLEHQATPDKLIRGVNEWLRPSLHGNFDGWIQLRKCIPGECQ